MMRSMLMVPTPPALCPPSAAPIYCRHSGFQQRRRPEMRSLFRRRQIGSFRVIGLSLGLLLLACSPARPSQPGGPAEPAAAPAVPKRLVTAIMVEPSALYRPLIPGSYVIQTADLGDTILHIGLSTNNAQRVL